MKTSIPGIIIAVVVFFLFQTTVPFPYGFIFGIIIGGIIIWYAKRRITLRKDSLLSYRRLDPVNEKEKIQNDEALESLEKKYVEDKISKEEYKKRKKVFEDAEGGVRKCKVCGSEEFEFVFDRRIEEVGEPISDEGYYRCKKCGAK